MFAYCPSLTQKICGLSDNSQAYDMNVYADEETKVVSSDQMRYIRGVSQNEREYDACYYLIRAGSDVEETEGKSIYFKLSKKTEMNVFI